MTPNMSVARRAERPPARLLLAALALSAGLGACGLSGCDGEDADQRALSAAGIKLEALSVAGANPVAAVDHRRKALKGIVDQLSSVAGGSDTQNAAAANLLIARAKSGLGELAAGDAAEIERRFLSQVSSSRALLDQWISQHSVAAALGQYDPAKDLASLDKEMADRTAESNRLQAQKAQQESVVAGILSRAEQARAEAKQARDREATIRRQAEGQSQTARAESIKQATEAARAADAKDRQASELAADAAKEQPRVAELTNEADKLRRQVESLGKAKQDIQKRAADAKRQSSEATTEANAVGDKIRKALSDLDATREAAGSPTTEAVSQFTAASKAAKSASATAQRESKTSALAAQGGFEQSKGEALATKARSLAAYSSLLQAMMQAKPPVPGAEPAKTNAALSELDTLKKDAQTALDEARAAYERAGGAGDLKAKLDAVVRALDELKSIKSRPAGAAPVADKPAEKPAETPASEAGESHGALSPEDAAKVQTEVRAMLRELAAATAAGDMDKAMSFVATSSESERQAVGAVFPLMAAAKSLDGACTAKWGKDLSGLLAATKVPAIKANPMFMMLMPMLGAMSKGGGGLMDVDAAENASIKAISLTEADVSSAGVAGSSKARKDGDAWKIMLPGAAASAAASQGGPMLAMAKGLTDALNKAATGTKDGKYATADDMLTDLAASMMAGMGALVPPPGGRVRPGGGGQEPPPPPPDDGGGG